MAFHWVLLRSSHPCGGTEHCHWSLLSVAFLRRQFRKGIPWLHEAQFANPRPDCIEQARGSEIKQCVTDPEPVTMEPTLRLRCPEFQIFPHPLLV